MNLEISIITYNRSQKLINTLNSLLKSEIKDFKITIFDNCSSDDTANVCERYIPLFKNLNYVKNKLNIGFGANFLRAMESSVSTYTWILCDDDFIELKKFDDVLEKIDKEKFDLIHVGAHPVSQWSFGGSIATAKQLVEAGYPYFKYSSFLPCNIFRTELFQEEYITKGYENVVNSYPHMPYLFDVFLKDRQIYIAQEQIVVAAVVGQHYDSTTWFFWWLNTCIGIKDWNYIHLAFFNVWDTEKKRNFAAKIFFPAYLYGNELQKLSIKLFIKRTFSLSERSFFYYKLYYFKVRQLIKWAIGYKKRTH